MASMAAGVKEECRKPTKVYIFLLATCFFTLGSLIQNFYGSAIKTMIINGRIEEEEPATRPPWSSSPDDIQEQQPQQQKVLLVTYGRSGSTFTSALITRPKDVFYIFEPLDIIKYKTFARESERAKHSVAIIDSYLSCHFPPDYVYTLLNRHSGRAQPTKDVADCLKRKGPGTQHVSCYVNFLEDCQKHNITFIKTIRFKMEWTERLLKENPNFKVLYLIRDPRPTLFSQATNFKNFNWTRNLTDFAKFHCGELENDLTAAERFKKLYPGRVKGIRYEHGATDPFGYTREIYEFLRLEYSENVEKFIEEITHHKADNLTRRQYSFVRANSTQTMRKWRDSTGFDRISIIDKYCGHLYSKLGYVKAKSQKHLNSSSPFFIEPEPNGIFN